MFGAIMNDRAGPSEAAYCYQLQNPRLSIVSVVSWSTLFQAPKPENN